MDQCISLVDWPTAFTIVACFLITCCFFGYMMYVMTK